MRPILAGETAVDKLDTFRKALGEAKIRDQGEDSEDEILMPTDIDEAKDRWDCETILSEFVFTACTLVLMLQNRSYL